MAFGGGWRSPAERVFRPTNSGTYLFAFGGRHSLVLCRSGRRGFFPTAIRCPCERYPFALCGCESRLPHGRRLVFAFSGGGIRLLRNAAIYPAGIWLLFFVGLILRRGKGCCHFLPAGVVYSFEGSVYLFCVGSKLLLFPDGRLFALLWGHTLFLCLCDCRCPVRQGLFAPPRVLIRLFVDGRPLPPPFLIGDPTIGAHRVGSPRTGLSAYAALLRFCAGSAVYTERNGNVSVLQNVSAYFLSFLIFCVHLNN